MSKPIRSKKRPPIVKEDFVQSRPPTKIDNPVEENIFDLTKLVAIQNEEQIKKETPAISSDKQAQLLIDYEELPKTEWESIPKTIHIRYLRKDGKFRSGGYVRNIWIDAYGKHKGRKCIQLASAIAYKAPKWSICIDDIDKIWKKSGFDNIAQPSPSVDISGIKTNTESITYLTNSLEQLKINMTRLQNEQRRTLDLIKKIHKIGISAS